MCSGGSSAYSVLTHEEIVDLLWSDEIRPLLLKRYPGLSEDQIKEAHAYAYGGAVIQDLGYYPFGSTEFSNLVHYVRSGDFVQRAIDDPRRQSGQSIIRDILDSIDKITSEYTHLQFEIVWIRTCRDRRKRAGRYRGKEGGDRSHVEPIL